MIDVVIAFFAGVLIGIVMAYRQMEHGIIAGKYKLVKADPEGEK